MPASCTCAGMERGCFSAAVGLLQFALHLPVLSLPLLASHSLAIAPACLQTPCHPPLSSLQAINGSSRSTGLSGSLGAGSPQRSEDLGMSSLAVDSYGDLPAAAAVLQSPALPQVSAASAGGAASLYIKGMPEDADKLWLYEKFARWAAGRQLGVDGGASSLLVCVCVCVCVWWVARDCPGPASVH